METRAPLSDEELSLLSRRFTVFADVEAHGYAPLYEQLSRGIAADPDLLALASRARGGQPPPNMILGAVHCLLLNGEQHPLADFYASLAAKPRPPEEAFPYFRDFCGAHTDQIATLLETRLVQTNEVGRSSLLMPAFAHVASVAGGAPLALVEIGPSAGLNLVLDRYHFDYGDGLTAGDPASPVQLRCQRSGDREPPVRSGPPAIGFRVGVDLNPVDVTDPDEALWLKALVWPERPDRMTLQSQAIKVLVQDPPEVVRGDASELLPELLARAPQEMTLCVFHSFVMHQVPAEGRARIAEAMAAESTRRPLYEISLAVTSGMDAQMEIARNVRGEWRRSVLATCQAHGQSICWLM